MYMRAASRSSSPTASDHLSLLMPCVSAWPASADAKRAACRGRSRLSSERRAIGLARPVRIFLNNGIIVDTGHRFMIYRNGCLTLRRLRSVGSQGRRPAASASSEKSASPSDDRRSRPRKSEISRGPPVARSSRAPRGHRSRAIRRSEKSRQAAGIVQNRPGFAAAAHGRGPPPGAPVARAAG